MSKNKYLILEANDICIKTKDYNVSSSILFNSKNIPEKYQKIILELCINNLFKQGDAKEILTGIPFDITRYPITEKDNKKIINGVDTYNLNLHISTPLKKEEIYKVINFYNELKTSGYLESYIKTIESLFKIVLNEKKTEKKLLKLK